MLFRSPRQSGEPSPFAIASHTRTECVPEVERFGSFRRQAFGSRPEIADQGDRREDHEADEAADAEIEIQRPRAEKQNEWEPADDGTGEEPPRFQERFGQRLGIKDIEGGGPNAGVPDPKDAGGQEIDYLHGLSRDSSLRSTVGSAEPRQTQIMRS